MKNVYVEMRYHEPMEQSSRRVNQALGSLLTGDKVGRNWYGPFSSGRCGILRYWHWNTSDPVMFALYKELHALFELPWKGYGPREYRYPELEIDRGNGNLGSNSIAFNATDDNIHFVHKLLTQAGFWVRLEKEI